MMKSKQLCPTRHLVADEVAVFVTVDLLIALKDAVAGTSAHEVVITLTGRQAAAHCRPRLAAPLTALQRNQTACFLVFIL